MDEVIDGPIGQELLDKVTDSPNTHLVGLAFMDAGARNLYDTKKQIKDIASSTVRKTTRRASISTTIIRPPNVTL